MKKNKLKVRLQKTIAKERKAYWSKNEKIRSNKRLSKFEKQQTIADLRGERNFKIDLHKKDFSETLFGQNHPSKYEGMKFDRRVTKGKWTNPVTGEERIYPFTHKQDHYTFTNESNIDERIRQIINEDGVKSVLLVQKVKDEDGNYHYLSENITKTLMSRLQASGSGVEEHLAFMLKTKKSLEEFDHVEYSIRVLY